MKIKLLYAILLAGFISCSTESSTINPMSTKKTEEVLKFEKSIKSLSNPENRETPEEMKNRQSLELSDRRKDLLIPSAIELIKSTGATQKQITEATQGDRDKILTWAVKIYNEKLDKINQNSKN
ncbi:hypothetical protein SAMN05421664_3133 [Chryseobacterium soldanellicola]|uniref:Lipoprotein n=1 Tax=Chryseobacterium soldanellicola TaxID=311333 RepID=A0A1H1FLS1_9FLAO|nr:hypothetical protein [Chryseobacterium soldanellicola]SDR01834.1 hypothetical protein SAMN05421664_3133 [Chryseobacterium soldanellicola]